jgi:hypothetical protein
MADVRKIKVLSVEFNREFTPPAKKFTIYYFTIKTDDELVGEFSTNARNQVKFLVGDTYEVKIEEKSTGKGKYLFFDYSDGEKEKRKEGTAGGGSNKGGSYKYVRSRAEVLLIISQSSYEAAVNAAIKIEKATNTSIVNSHNQLSTISKAFVDYIAESSGLTSPECKSDNKDALKVANEKSIVYQKALKIAVEALDLSKMEESIGADKLRTTRGIISLTDLIVKDIIAIANGL